MNQYTRDTIKRCAEVVRYWAESKVKDFEKDLNGWCGICSAELWYQLKDFGIDAEIRMGSDEDGSHIYLVVDDHIVDVTATQFSEFSDVPILIMHERQAQHWFHESSDFFFSPLALRKMQVSNRWPLSQIAYKTRQIRELVA